MNGSTPLYVEWGAGLGFSLADPGAGDPASAYTGKVKGFTFTLTGTTEWQDVSVRVKHSASDTEVPPIVNVTVPGTWSVRFADAKCSNYPYLAKECIESTNGVYMVWLFVDGGTQAGDFHICLTNLNPIL
jgi:hypothetical protein